MTRISKSAIVKSKGNYRLLGRLMGVFNLHQKTVEGLLASNDIRLTAPDAVKVLMEELNMTREEIIIEEPITA